VSYGPGGIEDLGLELTLRWGGLRLSVPRLTYLGFAKLGAVDDDFVRSGFVDHFNVWLAD
jgi:hypothetical protein